MIRIHSGLFDHMVMARDPVGYCAQQVCGEAAPGAPLAVVFPDGRTVELGYCDGAGKFQFTLTNLKTGGPYELTLRAGMEEMRFSDLLVGDLWMLAGQSNMAGWADLTGAAEPDPMIRCFGLDDKWQIAREPLHDMLIAHAPIHWELNGGREAVMKNPYFRIKGVGPGLYFAREMLKRTGVPQGVIASAHGGTSVSQWDPALRDQGENSLYGAMFRRFVLNGSPRLAGVLWYQGCNEAWAGSEEEIARYGERTIALFQAMRRDFGAPELPVVMVQLAGFNGDRSPECAVRWSNIREQQRQLPQKCKNLLCIPALNLERDDYIHLSGNGHRILAGRLAGAMEFLRTAGECGMPPIEVDSIACERMPAPGPVLITVTFKNVRGELHADGIPFGFSLHFTGSETGKGLLLPFRVRLEGNKAVVATDNLACSKIAYGFGCAPAVNIRDGAGRLLPAFGPLYFRKEVRSTPMLQQALVSAAQEGDDYASLAPTPEKMAGLHFVPCPASAPYLLPERFTDGRHYHYFFRWKISCRHAAALEARLGSDGGFRLALDGREIGGCAEVGNPILLDEFRYFLQLTPGEHEFALGLDGRCGNAWGICFRIVDPADVLEIGNEESASTLLPDFIG